MRSKTYSLKHREWCVAVFIAVVFLLFCLVTHFNRLAVEHVLEGQDAVIARDIAPEHKF